MDSIYVAYFEETEELLQRAEECLMRLELAYSADDINELFRIAHSVKGSSQMIGFDQIGNLTHKLEDLLDSVRKGRIAPDSVVLRICFEGLDHVKTLIESMKGNVAEEIGQHSVVQADRIGAEIDRLLNKQPDAAQNRGPAPLGGIVNVLKTKEKTANHRVYISVTLSDDAPMAEVVLFMIFNNLKEVGSLEYSSVSEDDLPPAAADRPITSLEMILNTELEASELYSYFEMMYVENVAIVDLSAGSFRKLAAPADKQSAAFFETFFAEFKKLHRVLFQQRNAGRAEIVRFIREQSTHLLAEAKRIPPNAVLPDIERFYDLGLCLLSGKVKYHEDTAGVLQREYIGLLEKVYGYVRGKIIYKIFRAGRRPFLNRLNEISEKMDKTLVRKLLVDVSGLTSLDEKELAGLIDLKRRLGAAGISLVIIAGRPPNKRMVNLFESIRPLEPFDLYHMELDALLSDD